MTIEPRVTFVGHDASRTGAPTVLASFLRWLTDGTAARPDLVLLRGGPLRDTFERLVPSSVGPSATQQVAMATRDGWRATRAGGHGDSGWFDRIVAPRALWRGERDAVMVNSLAALTAAVHGVNGRWPIVCYVHELDGVAERVLPGSARARDSVVAAVTRFVAAGPAVSEMLVERWGVDPGRVVTVDPFIDPPTPTAASAAAVRRGLGLDPDQFLVAAVGSLGPRKGSDYFVDLISCLASHPSRPHGLWVGGDQTSTRWDEMVHDIDEAGLTGRMHLLPSVDDAIPHLVAADVLVTVAREDPFPLVVLEAAAVGTAVAGFAAGGAAALLGHLTDRQTGRSALVQVGDVLGLSEEVARLADSLRLRASCGAELSMWVHRTHLTTHLAPHLWAAICEVA